MSKIGVFVCHCGENIAKTVDVVKVTEEAAKIKGVALSMEYKYMCSSPGQDLIVNAIKEKGLTGIVVAACSPRMHEVTFRNATQKAGLNPFLVEMANIREHCSWVHDNKEEATEKAIQLVKMMVEKVKKNSALEKISIPITKKAMIIGGGVAGIQAALDIANGGHEVVLVEKLSSIGGHMAGLSETFPTLDCSQCILTPKMVEVASHPKIKLYTYSEIEEVSGYIGNFDVKIKKKASYVKNSLCTGCGACLLKCPKKNIPSEFDRGLGMRRAIYIPFPQAVPNKPVIDKENCIKFKTGKCGICAKVCEKGAIDYEQQDEFITERVGAIVVATGFELWDFRNKKTGYGEYGYGKYKDVLDGLQFERLLSASGPTGGEIVRPSDGKLVKKIAFLKCIGSRDKIHGLEYCSKICCMYTAKHATLYKHKVHEGQAYVFYMDIRAGGKNYDEFTRRTIEKDGAKYIRGRVSKIYNDGTSENPIYKIISYDTLSNTPVEIDVDMVVLASAVYPRQEATELAQKLGISYDKYSFYSEAHPKLQPVETATAGVFLSGTCQAPKDIPDSVAGASGAASKVQGLFSSDTLDREPIIATVNNDTCVGCMACKEVCAYGAIDISEVNGKIVAKVNEGLCQGCGACVALCRSNSLDLQGYTDEQMFSILDVKKDKTKKEWKPNIIAFVCNWCTYAGADLAGTSRYQYPANVNIIKHTCTGRIDPLFIVKAFESGADAVLVSGCHPGDCHYSTGNYYARRRWIVFRELLKFVGIPEERVFFSWVSAAEGNKWADLITDITKKIKDMGEFKEYKKIRDIYEK